MEQRLSWPTREGVVFIVEMNTREGRVTERYETYEEARRRVDQFSADSLVGVPFIFQELADGSERLVREDGKPLQFHRRLVEDEGSIEEAPLPLSEEPSGLVGPDGKLRLVTPHPPEDDSDDPLPLA
jgi:hypothetical protein